MEDSNSSLRRPTPSPPRIQEFDNLGRVSAGLDMMKCPSPIPPRNVLGRNSRHKPTAVMSPSPPRNTYLRGYEAPSTTTGRSNSPDTRHSAGVEEPSSGFGGLFKKVTGGSRSPVQHSNPSDRRPEPPDRHQDPDMDEDLLLALELSKNDTGQPSSEVSDNTRYASSLPASSYASGLPASSLPHSKRRDAMNDPNRGSIRDLLLALQLSEETAKGSSTTSPVGRRKSTSLEELLALESSGRTGMNDSEERSVTDFVAAGISTDKTSRPNEQFRILEQIREEQEQKELMLALKVSQEHPAPPAIDIKDQARDFLLSQQKAMEEWSKSTSNAAGESDQDDDHDDWKAPPLGRRKSTSSQDSTERRRELVQRGTAETQEAITSGQAHIVTCRGCQGRLQAPVSYQLVFCPKCQTISPA